VEIRRRAAASALIVSLAWLAGHASVVRSYANPSSAQLIIGDDFLSSTTGWIAVGQSGSYASNGGCDRGLGNNCNTTRTVIYRTEDGGMHWHRELVFTSLPGPQVWIRFFSAGVGFVAATVGPVTPSSSNYYDARSVLLRTSDGGKHWSRYPLPKGYSIGLRTITFPDPRHGWLFYGGAASGSMSVYMYRTENGGRSWSRVACASLPASLPNYACRLHSGIAFDGDKEFLSFSNRFDGWLTVFSNAGIPEILHSGNGGRTWRYQAVGLPLGLHQARTPKAVYLMGTFDQPRLFGRLGILPEVVTSYPPRSNTGRSRLFLYRSLDGGRTWQFYRTTPVTSPSIEQFGFGEGTLSSLPRPRNWLFVSGKNIWRTANAGRTWSRSPMHIPGMLHLASLSFVDPSHGWALVQPAGNNGGLLGGTSLRRTSDGGKHWSVIRLPR